MKTPCFDGKRGEQTCSSGGRDSAGDYRVIKSRPNLVIEAPPGAGKTTRVPPALLDREGEVVVLEPRRIAARLAARRVAGELGEQLGETVGYQVRFEEAVGPKTRLRFVTEGVLTRRLLSDPLLKGVDAVCSMSFTSGILRAILHWRC